MINFCISGFCAKFTFPDELVQVRFLSSCYNTHSKIVGVNSLRV